MLDMPGTGGAWGRIRKHLTGRAMSDEEAKKIGLVAILTARAGSAAALKDALAAIIPGVSAASGGMISLPTVQWQTWLTGLALMLGIGLVVGALPAMRAMRLKIVDALAGR